MEPIRRTLLEKLAHEMRFDRVVREHNAWLVVGSSQFPEDGLLRIGNDSVVVSATLMRSRLQELASITLRPSKIESKHPPYLAFHQCYVFRGYGHG